MEVILSQAELIKKSVADDTRDHLRAIVGLAHVLHETSDTAGYLTDWTGQFSSKALAVVRPASTSQLSQIVQYCNANGIAVVPQGGGTGLCGGGVPIDGRPSVVLSLTRMNALRNFDLAGRTIVVEAGMVLETLHLSIEAVMPDGSVINALTGLRKDNTGYDIKDLLIGAEGTLGVITAAVFKLFQQPTNRVTAFLSVASLSAATEVLNRLQDHTGSAVEAFEYMPQHAIDVICCQFPDIRRPLAEHTECGILVEVASSRAIDARELPDGGSQLSDEVMTLLGDLMESGLVLDAMIAQSEKQRADLWHMRESILEAITANGPAYHLDISLPLSRVADFVGEMDQTSAKLGFQPITVGHLGDGNLHYALTPAPDREWSTLPLEAAKKAAFDLLGRLNGSFSAEHGIGQSKLAVMTTLKEPSQLAVMRAIKTALDPNNIMNPGKLVPDV